MTKCGRKAPGRGQHSPASRHRFPVVSSTVHTLQHSSVPRLSPAQQHPVRRKGRGGCKKHQPGEKGRVWQPPQKIMGDATPGAGGREAAAGGALACARWHSPQQELGGLGVRGWLRGVCPEKPEPPDGRKQSRKKAEHVTHPHSTICALPILGSFFWV